MELTGNTLRRNSAAITGIKATHTVADYYSRANCFEAQTRSTQDAWDVLTDGLGTPKLIDRRHIDGTVIVMIHPDHQWYILRTAAV